MTAAITCEAFDEPACAGSCLDTSSSPADTITTAGGVGAFEFLPASLTLPPGTGSARCDVRLEFATGVGVTAWLDEITLDSAIDALIFRDGFASGDPFEWSDVTPGSTRSRTLTALENARVGIDHRVGSVSSRAIRARRSTRR